MARNDDASIGEQRDGRRPPASGHFDALRVKIREDAVLRNKAICLALGILPDGTRDILGLWIESTEGATFWLKVFNDRKTRGVADVRNLLAQALRPVHPPASAEAAAAAVDTFAQEPWGQK